MDKAIGWELYRTLLAVLTEGSLSGAARMLDITQPTAGRHIAALEHAFGQVLFTRSPTGLLPTDTALTLRVHAQAMQSHAEALARAATAHDHPVSGTVRLSASEILSTEVLPSILAQLHQTHPALTIELVSSNRMQDLLQREADIAVRMAPPAQEQLVARRIGSIEIGLYAHQRYLLHHGTPQRYEDLPGHTLIGFDRETPFLRDALNHVPGWTRDAFSLRADSDIAQLALLRAGCGIGVCQAALAKRDNTLVRVLPDMPPYLLETWVTMHEGLRRSPPCRIVFDALAAGLEDYIGSA